MSDKKNIVSLFDGLSGCRLALDTIGIKYDNYYASEVDKHAVGFTSRKFPDTIHLGDVRNVTPQMIDGQVFLMGSGSPCQSFSFTGKMKGMSTKCEIDITTLEQYLKLKEEGFEFEGQSYLFWEFVRLKEELKPKYWLLENVQMIPKWKNVITKAVGIEPIEINSALVSGQNRVRNYWTNINSAPSGLFGDMKCMIPQPKDRGILLKHILETDVPEKYFLSEKMMSYFKNRAANFNQGKINIRDEEGKASTITASAASCDISDNFIKIDKKGNVKENQDKASCFTAGGHSGGNHSDMDLLCVAMRGRNPENPKSIKSGLHTEQMIEPRLDGKTNTITTVQKDNLVLLNNRNSDLLCIDTNGRIDSEKTGTVNATYSSGPENYGSRPFILNTSNYRIRRLTPTEVCKLQTIPSDYFFDKENKQMVSDTQIYRMCGNGWTNEVISYIFSFIKEV
jgi:DNA (cytosine-5)-methyltransferase 3A